MGLKTKILSPDELKIGAKFLQRGETVAFPTETVYGLGANALDPAAVQKIFLAKGRPGDNPLIVHCYRELQLLELVREIPRQAKLLMKRFWPGPLTLVLPKTALVPTVVSAGLDTVGIRIPQHPLALQLLEAAGVPVAAPSANLSGRPSPTRAEHVLADLDGRIAAIVDGGETGWGLESTVLDCTTEPFRILRPGGITKEQLRRIIPIESGEGLEEPGPIDRPRSPGMKYQHYAPQALVYLVLGEAIPVKIREMGRRFQAAGKKVAVLCANEQAELYPEFVVLKTGPRGDHKAVAARLYHLLREADRLKVQVLLAEGLKEENLGLAIMNRLRKAAGTKVIQT